MTSPADTIREARLADLLRLIADELELGEYKVPTSIRTIREAAAALTELEADRDRLADTLRDLAALERPADLMRQIARAALDRQEQP